MDVSANADFDMMICSGFVPWRLGHRFSSPIWAGFAALANQLAVSERGKANDRLYQSDSSYPAYSINNPTMTHDIIGNVKGNYPAMKGYDLLGGLGCRAA